MPKHVAMFICLMDCKCSLDEHEKSNSIVTLASFYQETIQNRTRSFVELDTKYLKLCWLVLQQTGECVSLPNPTSLTCSNNATQKNRQLFLDQNHGHGASSYSWRVSHLTKLDCMHELFPDSCAQPLYTKKFGWYVIIKR